MRRSLAALAFTVFVAGLALSWAQEAKLSEAEKKALARLRQTGAHAMEIAQNDSRIEVSFPQSDAKITDEQLKLLKELKTLVHLNLRGHPITDDQLANVASITSLTRLHLEK